MSRLHVLLLSLIFFVGVGFRFFELGSVPQSLNWDEVSWGYNAYSIATTGKDEHGVSFPLSFKAFGDYKQPMYVYLDALPTLLWGLTGFAVRFPSALIGSFTILAVFFLVRELFAREKIREVLALVTAALFALSPWSIQFSRVAFEANVGIFFTISGVALFFRGYNKKNIWYMVAGGVVMSLSCYTYHSQKLFTPLLFIGLLLFARKYFWLNKKHAVIILVAFFIANIFWVADSRTTARGRSVMFTSQQTQLLAEPTKRLISDKEKGDMIGQVLHNRRLVYANTYLTNYLLHFDPNYFFLTGDNPRHHPPGMGILYLVSLPFIIGGAVILWKKYRYIAYVVLGWLLLAPVASALAVDAPNASRSMVFLPTWQILTAIGIVSLVYYFKKQKRFFIVAMLACAYLVNVMYYSHWYFNHTDTEYAGSWQYGYKEAVQYAASVNPNNKVYFSSSVEQPYIFYLFHNNISPREYLSSGGSQKLQEKCFSIRNAYFGKCEEKFPPSSGDVLLSIFPEVNPRIVKVKEILYPNEEIAVQVYKYK